MPVRVDGGVRVRVGVLVGVRVGVRVGGRGGVEAGAGLTSTLNLLFFLS